MRELGKVQGCPLLLFPFRILAQPQSEHVDKKKK